MFRSKGDLAGIFLQRSNQGGICLYESFDLPEIRQKLIREPFLDLLYGNIGAGLDTQKILVVFSASGEICQPTAGLACASQLLQSVYQLLVAGITCFVISW